LFFHAPAHVEERKTIMRYLFLWLIGVPIPVLLVIYLMFH
jgi:hypothetical protein